MNNFLTVIVNLAFCFAVNQAYADNANTEVNSEIKALAIQSIEQSMVNVPINLAIETQLPEINVNKETNS